VVRGWYCAWMVLALGCAGDLKDPKRFDFLLDRDSGAKPMPTPSDAGNSTAAPVCATDLFNAKCNSSACHGAGAKQVDLVSADVAERLIDAPSSDTGMCKGRTLVTSDGTSSLLVDKLADPAACGTKMPLVGSLTAAEKTCLTDWVTAVGGGKG
jgi:hypothetical protein